MPKVTSETTAIELLEEALHLVRGAAAALTFYYLGAVPFVLGLLFFWADMSRSAYAAGRCASASLGLALGYLWMKCWQAAYAHALRGRLGLLERERWGWREGARMVLTQAILQPWGLILFTPLLLVTVPFPFFFAFFHNITALGQGGAEGVRGVIRRAWSQAALWQGQNVQGVIILGFFSLLVFLNVALALGMAPYLAQSLLGVQSRFTQSPSALLNSTFVAAAGALTYLCVDPLVKAAYVLRCFYGESLKTGEAIWADLARLKRAGTLALLLLALLAGARGSARAAEAAAPAHAAGAPVVAPAELDRAIQETLRNPRYAWRMPRQLESPQDDEKKSLPVLFLDSVVRAIGRGIGWVFGQIGRFVRWLADHLKPDDPAEVEKAAKFGEGIFTLTRILLYVFVTLVLIVVALALWHLWSQRRRLLTPAVAAVSAEPVAPDLTDEQVVADQLPADGWLLLAQQMIERGELRLALRALYLASLAALGQAGLIRIRRSKSNLDYVRELLRRAHAWPGLVETFKGSVAVFDQAWYGRHEVTPEGLQEFRANYEKIKGMVGNG